MFKKSFLNSLVLCICLQTWVHSDSFAGGRVGNGGNAVVCFDKSDIAPSIYRERASIPGKYFKNIVSVTPLDWYEVIEEGTQIDAKNPQNRPDSRTLVDFFLSNPTETSSEYIVRVANRFNLISPGLTAEMIKVLNRFNKERVFFTPSLKENTKNEISAAGVRQIQDYNIFPYEVDREFCVISTIINQFFYFGEAKLVVDQRFFTQLSNAVFSKQFRDLIWLHEVVEWIDTQKNGNDSSDRTRFAVSTMVSKNRFTIPEVEARFTRSGFWTNSSSEMTFTQAFGSDFLEKVESVNQAIYRAIREQKEYQTDKPLLASQKKALQETQKALEKLSPQQNEELKQQSEIIHQIQEMDTLGFRETLGAKVKILSKMPYLDIQKNEINKIMKRYGNLYYLPENTLLGTRLRCWSEGGSLRDYFDTDSVMLQKCEQIARKWNNSPILRKYGRLYERKLGYIATINRLEKKIPESDEFLKSSSLDQYVEKSRTKLKQTFHQEFDQRVSSVLDDESSRKIRSWIDEQLNAWTPIKVENESKRIIESLVTQIKEECTTTRLSR